MEPIDLSGSYVGQPPTGEPVLDEFVFGLERLIDGLAAYVASRPEPDPGSHPAPVDDSPPAVLGRAQADLAAATAQRKAAQARVKELIQRENQAERERNRARDAARR